MLAFVAYIQAICTPCQSEIRRDCMRFTDIPSKRNFITWPRRRVECVCPNCRAVYVFTQRMEPGGEWKIEGAEPRPISNYKQEQRIRAKFPAIG